MTKQLTKTRTMPTNEQITCIDAELAALLAENKTYSNATVANYKKFFKLAETHGFELIENLLEKRGCPRERVGCWFLFGSGQLLPEFADRNLSEATLHCLSRLSHDDQKRMAAEKIPVAFPSGTSRELRIDQMEPRDVIQVCEGGAIRSVPEQVAWLGDQALRLESGTIKRRERMPKKPYKVDPEYGVLVNGKMLLDHEMILREVIPMELDVNLDEVACLLNGNNALKAKLLKMLKP